MKSLVVLVAVALTAAILLAASLLIAAGLRGETARQARTKDARESVELISQAVVFPRAIRDRASTLSWRRNKESLG
jgi:curli biogenesis system outer membrane secretion channel CsgG